MRGFQTSWAPRGARQQTETRRVRLASAQRAAEAAAPPTQSGFDFDSSGYVSRAAYIGYYTSDPL